ncbi:MAG: polysaccharide biosynthesis/export family protein [Candidatus Bathyarchaeota archaeon]|nr:MAG: polysaccharide biosynthesis/export family protein [Candidatus Bathyarchaeota archaeon]
MRRIVKILIYCIMCLFLILIIPFSNDNLLHLHNVKNYQNMHVSTVWAIGSQVETKDEKDRSDTQLISQDYIIGKGDVLEIVVWRNERISRKVVVRPDGRISLPLIQDIEAKGLTVLQLKNQIINKLKDYMDYPKVSVIVSDTTSYRVSVLGRVERPGVYPITGATTLVEAIALAGGFSEWANKRKIRVVTHEKGKERTITVNYKKFESGKDQSLNITLQPGDIIIVP